MVIAVRTQEVDGDLVVVKEAATDDDVARLHREATMLTRGRHPGVVEVVAVEDRAIHLRHAGTPLSRLGPLAPDQAAGLVSAVADVVDALHRQGVVHGELDADHVLIDPRGRPRLCGFGRATEHSPEGAADDVAALGHLLAGLVRDGRGRRWANPPAGLGSRRRRRRAEHELTRLAERASVAEPQQRPSARQLAKAIHATVPGQSLPAPVPRDRTPSTAFAAIPDDVDPTADLGWTADDLAFLAQAHDDVDLARSADASASADAPRPVELDAGRPGPTEEDPRLVIPMRPPSAGRWATARRVPGRALVLALLLLLGMLVGVAGARALDPFGGDRPSPPATAAEERADPATAPPSATPEAAAPTSWPERCELPATPGPDVDADGCPEGVHLDGRRATVGPHTVTLGTEDDEVALGDWDCDGIATPALLRPRTGEVFVFPSWSFDEPLEVVATTVVPDATAITTGEGACPPLLATTPGGPVTVEPVP